MDELQHLTRQAVTLLQQGDIDAAEELAQQALKLKPEHAEAHHLLGLIAGRRGLHELADSRISRAVEISPGIAIYHVNHSLALRQAGRPEEALAACDRAVGLQPDLARAHQERSIVLRSLGRLNEALEACHQALAIKPDFVEACISRGNALYELDRLEEALNAYDRAIQLAPTSAQAHNMRANVLRRLDRLGAAEAACATALRLNPRLAGAYNNLGLILNARGDREGAIRNYRMALSLAPGKAGFHVNLGNAYRNWKRPTEALECYQAALSLEPGNTNAHLGLGSLYWNQDRLEQAFEHYKAALELNPESIEARWAYSLSRISRLEGMTAHTSETSGFRQEFEALDTWFSTERSARGHRVVGSLTPFFMAYREENNRDALARYGHLCTRLMKCWLDTWHPEKPSPVAGNRIKTGIVSAHIKDHPVWNALIKGWIQELDRNHFELHVFHLDAEQDQETAWASTRAESLTSGKRNLREWTGLILDAQPDVLIYPEIGMDAMTVQLASMRLAPVQLASWGHAETSGLPTLDYYLSADALEPAEAEEHYTEKLVRLPRLGCCYQPLEVEDVDPDPEALGIDPGMPIALCPGTAYKYMPEHDRVFPEIAKRTGSCQFIFFAQQDRGGSDLLKMRLEAAFAEAGLDFRKHVIFVPWLERPAFYALMKTANVMLDTIGFSGFNTAMQAVECGLPIVTREGRFMRGRLASGILQQIGMQELVANSDDDYISKAVRLVQDPAHRLSVRNNIASRRHLLFNDVVPVRALENFLDTVVQK
ncbi:MAG TPA: tetratricopeptide repeat protein [Gammaproteobacteria bacterium]|nr:tetratricopeptide repeat protein [Gammaproteobacteria bacterium]